MKVLPVLLVLLLVGCGQSKQPTTGTVLKKEMKPRYVNSRFGGYTVDEPWVMIVETNWHKVSDFSYGNVEVGQKIVIE